MTQYRIDVDIDWLGGLRDRLGRLTIDTLKGWLILALLAAILAFQVWQASRGPVPTSDPHPAPTPAPPAPGKVDPGPKPDGGTDDVPPPTARTPETPLSKALRDYHRRFPAVVPKTLWELADKLDSGEIKDKDTSIKLYKRDAVALAQALDGIFTPGIDPNTKEGKVTKPGAISGPLRQTARALGYKPPAQAPDDAGSQSFAPESP